MPFADLGGSIHDDGPCLAKRYGREHEIERLVVGIEQQQERAVAHAFAIVIELVQLVSVEKDHQRLDEPLLPVFFGHRFAVEAQPREVADPFAAKRPSLEPAAAAECRMGIPKADHPARELEQAVVG